MRKIICRRNVIIGSIAIFCIAIILIIVFAILPILSKNPEQNQKINIESIKIQVGDQQNTSFDIEYASDDVAFNLIINDGNVNIIDYDYIFVSWNIIGNSLGCKVENGILSLSSCNAIGSITVRITVRGGNIKTQDITVAITPQSNWELRGIELIDSTLNNSYIEGQPIKKQDFIIQADFGDYKVNITDFETNADIAQLSDSELHVNYSHANINKLLVIPIFVSPKRLLSIEITNLPIKTSYIEGQKLDVSDIEITARYEYLTCVITDYYFDKDKILQVEDKSVLFNYSEMNPIDGQITKFVKLPISVTRRQLQDITFDTSNVKLHYVQGQKFNNTGLVVTAHYEYMSKIVTAYDIDLNTKLKSGDTDITVSYTENGISKMSKIKINVDAPYSNIADIMFIEHANEVALSWVYSYMTDNGEDKIDNTTFLEQGLTFDQVRGLYQVPVGAIVTLEAINPAITDFYFNGKAQGLAYPARTLQFELANISGSMEISIKRISGRRTVTVKNDINSAIFSYPTPWNGVLRESDIEKINFIFGEDNEEYYNIFIIDETEYEFAELLSFSFLRDTEVRVEKCEKTVGTAIILVYWDGMEVPTIVDKTDSNWLAKIPIPSRIGYTFIGWDNQGSKIFAEWELNNPSYSENFIGEWRSEFIDVDGTKIGCQIILNSNGSYTYKTYVNDEINIDLFGFYKYNRTDNEIVLLSIETNSDLLLVTADDLIMNVDTDLSVNIFIASGYELISYNNSFNKI